MSEHSDVSTISDAFARPVTNEGATTAAHVITLRGGKEDGMGTLTTTETTEKGAGKAPAAEKPEALARSLYEHFNARELDQAAALVADDCEWLDVASGAVFDGPKGYLEFDNGWLTAFPDGKLEVTNVVCEGDMVVTEFTGHGTQTGPLKGSAGAIPASGKKVDLKCLEVLQIRGGKIARARMYYDSGSLLRQVGAM
jgi:steroid delta-isomerase-like uncharacterized protein